MKHLCWVVVVLAAIAQPALAQAPAAPPAPEPLTGSSSEPIPESPAAAPAAPPAESVLPDKEMTLDRLVLSAVNRIDINFFGEVSLARVTGEKPAFAVGPLGVQVTAHLADHLIGRIEWIMKFRDAETVVDIERVYLEYRTERWAIEAGRTHSELGYWNTAFHHGTWLQLTIERPRVLAFEEGGGVLETHTIGVTAIYSPKRGDHGLEFVISTGNGRGRTIDAVQNTGDDNLAKSLLLRLGTVGIGHPALRFGANVAIDEIAPEDAAVRPLLPNKSIFELVTGVFLALRSERVIVFSETYNLLHHASHQTWQFTDGFLLVGYRFGQLVPYGEFELRRGNGARDPYYRPAAALGSLSVPPEDFVEGTAGLRYDVSPWSALKVELAAARFEHNSDYRAAINWSFGR